jgi:hypothetical protein
MSAQDWIITGDTAIRVVGPAAVIRRGDFATIEAAIRDWDDQETERRRQRLEELCPVLAELPPHLGQARRTVAGAEELPRLGHAQPGETAEETTAYHPVVGVVGLEEQA